jgi:hypothetical protein
VVRLVPSPGPRAWRRLSRSVRQVLATSLAPVLTAGGLALPSAAMTAVAVAGVTAAVAASAVATAPAAQAAPTGNGKALVLLQSGSTAPEKTVLTAAGWSVDQETPATWKTGSWTWNGSTVSFSDFAVLVIGDLNH